MKIIKINKDNNALDNYILEYQMKKFIFNEKINKEEKDSEIVKKVIQTILYYYSN